MSALDDIRLRAEAATEGPWAVEENEDGSCDGGAVYIDDGITWGRSYICQDIHQGEEGEADAEFIAHARTDIPRLLGALDAVEKVRKELFDLSNDEGLTIDRRATYRDASRAIYTAVNDALEAGK